MRPLDRSFYLSEDVVSLAQHLLGKVIQTNIDDQLCQAQIVETEAYRAPDDKACHAHLNRFTKRTKTMFLPGGHSYIYLCYGIHHLFNIVTGPEGVAHAILVRAVQPINGHQIMQIRRRKETHHVNLYNGPGKLTQAMGISKLLNAQTIYEPTSAIQIFDIGARLSKSDIIAGPRVGIGYAEESRFLPWRFYIKENKYVSKPLVVEYQ